MKLEDHLRVALEDLLKLPTPVLELMHHMCIEAAASAYGTDRYRGVLALELAIIGELKKRGIY